MKKVAILQSNYIPWKGYFDMIASVDEFILYDDVQFTKNDWRNRNRIKTPQGTQWITIPVGQDIDRLIRDVHLKDSQWQIKHWKILESNYCRSSHFSEIAELIKPMYHEREHRNLSALNREFIQVVCNFLRINTKISNSWDYDLKPGRSERLVDLCEQVGATEYISGPAAKGYLKENLFSEIGVNVVWFDYSGYPEYRQLWGNFVHSVSIVDLLFNCGSNSPLYMRQVKP